MAGFFKRFKINAVTEKRLGSYLLYAIGEIIFSRGWNPNCVTNQ
jgi:hypothetical protein